MVDNGERLDIKTVGNAIFPSLSKTLMLKDILVVPIITKNLLNISKLTLVMVWFLSSKP